MNRPLPKRFRRRLVGLIGELQQTLRDIRSWNDNRRDAEPIDVGYELVMLKLATDALAAFDRGDWDEHARLSAEMVETGQRILDAQKD